MVFDAVARHKSGRVLAMRSFRKGVKQQQTQKRKTADRSATEGRFLTLKEAETQHIETALERAGGNQGTAAALLGISRPALNRRLARMRGN